MKTIDERCSEAVKDYTNLLNVYYTSKKLGYVPSERIEFCKEYCEGWEKATLNKENWLVRMTFANECFKRALKEEVLPYVKAVEALMA